MTKSLFSKIPNVKRTYHSKGSMEKSMLLLLYLGY